MKKKQVDQLLAVYEAVCRLEEERPLTEGWAKAIQRMWEAKDAVEEEEFDDVV